MTKINIIQAVNQALKQEMETDESMLVLGEDVGVDGGVFRATDSLLTEYGEKRVFDTPLSEAGIIGASIGLAARGFKPVAEVQFSGFMYPGFDQLISHASRMRTRSRGRFTCPMVVRSPYSGGIIALEHHSESFEALYAHIPGLKVVIPSGPYNTKGLLTAAIRDPDPVVGNDTLIAQSGLVLDPWSPTGTWDEKQFFFVPKSNDFDMGTGNPFYRFPIGHQLVVRVNVGGTLSSQDVLLTYDSSNFPAKIFFQSSDCVAVVPSGEQGPVGPEGPEGPAGPQGVAGTDGTDGADGAPGEVTDYFEAVALAQAFLDCVEISANESVPDDDSAANARAEACFNQILSDDFVNTIDGVGFVPPGGSAPPGAIGGGTVFFPTPQSFIDFANGPADDIRENLTVQAGVYTVRNVPGENGDLGFTGGQNGSVSIRTSLSVFQNTLSDSFIFGELGSGPSGMIIRARLFFEVTEESPNSWKITRSRFSILDIVRADLMSLPRVTDLDDF